MSEKTVPAKTNGQTPATREEERYLKPPVDIYEQDSKLVVVCDVPGVRTEDVDVKVDDNILTIQGKTSYKAPAEPGYAEFNLLNFFRQFELPEQIDQEKISADLKNGVLTVQLPKVEKAKPKQIQIKVG
jgi:HSP20 family protein